MQGLYSYTLVPVQARTVEAFAAADPWHGGGTAQWSLDVFRMVYDRIEHLYAGHGRLMSQRGQGGQLGHGEVLGLLNAAEGRPRLLPIALTQFWQEGRVPTRDLPRLMAHMEPQTVTTDYFSRSARFAPWIVGYFLLAALAMAGLAAAAWGTSGHTMAEVPAAEWLSRPVTGEHEVSVEGLITLDGHMAAGPVRLPLGMYSEGGGGAEGNTLAWYKATDGERLLLLTPLYADGIERGATVTRIVGSVLRTADVQLSPAVLQAVAAKAPGLQAEYVTCEGWRWEDSGEGYLGNNPVPILFGAGVLVLLAGWFHLQHRLRLRRIAWFRGELAKLA